MARLLTQSQFARRIKLTRGRISQLVKAGVIQLVKGKVDPIQAETAINAKVDRTRQLPLELKSNQEKRSVPNQSVSNGYPAETNSNVLSLTDVRRNHEQIKAELTELQLQVKRGELIPKGEQIKWLIALGTAAKLAFLNLPKRLAPILAGMQDEKKIELLLRTEIHQVIRELEGPLSASREYRGRKKGNTRGSMGLDLETSG